MDDTERKRRLDKIKRLEELQSGSGRNLLEDAPEIEWIIPKVIPFGFSVCNYGPSQSFKTTIKLHEALAIASGTYSLYGKARKCKVMWIDEEMGFTGLSLKVRLLAEGMGLKPEQWIDNFYYQTMMDFKINSESAIPFIKAMVRNEGIDVFYIDSLFSTMIIDGNLSAENASALRNTNKLCSKLGTTLQTLAHIPKSQIGKNLELHSIYGSIDLGNQIDFGYAFQAVGKNKIRIKQTKGKHIPPNEFLDINGQIVGGKKVISLVNLGDTSEVTKQTNRTKIRDFIVELFQKDELFLERKEINEKVQKHLKINNSTYVYEVVKNLIEECKLIENDDGKIERGDLF